jgi:hypothetical protein
VASFAQEGHPPIAQHLPREQKRTGEERPDLPILLPQSAKFANFDCIMVPSLSIIG